jgi:hypothetical protein
MSKTGKNIEMANLSEFRHFRSFLIGGNTVSPYVTGAEVNNGRKKGFATLCFQP